MKKIIISIAVVASLASCKKKEDCQRVRIVITQGETHYIKVYDDKSPSTEICPNDPNYSKIEY